MDWYQEWRIAEKGGISFRGFPDGGQELALSARLESIEPGRCGLPVEPVAGSRGGGGAFNGRVVNHSAATDN